MIPETRQADTGQALRNSNRLTLPGARTCSYQRSFIPQTSSNWNSLPNSIQLCQDRKQFKRDIKILHSTPHPPHYYTLGTKLGNTLHTQLRVGMSRLNAHQYTIQKNTDPACACGHKHENTNHFILDCPLFTSERTDLFTKMSLQLNIDITKLTNATKLNILLFGHKTSKDKQVFLSEHFQKFLQSTGRLS